VIDEIFGCVGLTPVGPFAWGTKVNKDGAGIYVIVTNDDIVYIGKGANLGRRLKQFYRQKDKEPGKGNHKGGRDVFKLSTPLTLYWAVIPDCQKAEAVMLHWYVSRFKRLPFANKVLPRYPSTCQQ
jgi:hypothetical protein